jgi:hypothetical protein
MGLMILNLLALLAIVGVAAVINRVAARPLVNGWLWGLLGPLAITLGVLWSMTQDPRFAELDAWSQGRLFGQFAGGPATPALFLGVWKAWRFRRVGTAAAGQDV